jgi:cytochrome c-type protein NapB
MRAVLAAALALVAFLAWAEPVVDAMRGATPIMQKTQPPRLTNEVNDEFSQAVPVSLTHFVNRDGQRLGQVSTRRYFCLQCHVSQETNRPLVGNSFQRQK